MVSLKHLNPFNLYLYVVRAPAASVRVGEVVPLIVPGPDQVSDGPVPVTSDTHSVIQRHLRCYSEAVLHMQLCTTFLKPPTGFGPCVSWLVSDQ